MTGSPAWEWQLLDAAGTAVDQPISPAFGNRFDAESWLGETWRSLAGHGVVAARLLHHGEAAAADVRLDGGRSL